VIPLLVRFRPVLPPAALALTLGLALKAGAGDAGGAGSDLQVTDRQLAELAQSCGPDRVAANLRAIGATGSRAIGSPGLARTLDWTEQRLAAMGFEIWGRQRFSVLAPRDLGSSLAYSEDGETVRVPVYALWPNHIAAPFLPAGGLTAPLVDGGTGKLTEIEGRSIAADGGHPGAIMLLDFESGARWQDLAALGAGAVVFLPAPDASFTETLSKISEIPVQFPRFYVDDAGVAAGLRRAAARGASATLAGGMRWENTEAENLVAFLPVAAPAGAAAETLIVCLNPDDASFIPGLGRSGQTAGNLAAGLAALEALTDPRLDLARGHHLLVVVDNARGVATAGLRAFGGVVRDLNASRRLAWADEARTTPRQEFLIRKMKDIEPWLDGQQDRVAIQLGRAEAAVRWLTSWDSGPAPGPFAYRDPHPVTRSERIPQTDARQWFRERLFERVKQQQIAALGDVVRAERAAGVDPFLPDSQAPPDVLACRARSRYYRELSGAPDEQALVARVRAAPLDPALAGPADITPAALLGEFRASRAELAAERDRLATSLALRERLRGIDVTRGLVFDFSAGSATLTLTRGDPGGSRMAAGQDWFEWYNHLRFTALRNLERLSVLGNHRAPKAQGEGTPERPPVFDFAADAVVPAQGQLNRDLSLAGLSNYTLVTGNDNRLARMGPGDILPDDSESLARLGVQARTAALILAEVLRNPELMPHYAMNTPWCIDVEGVVVKQDVRAGPFPNLPVPGAIVALTAANLEQGVSGTRYEMSDARGFFRFEGVAGGLGNGRLDAFCLHPGSGMLAYAPDEKLAGRGGYEKTFGLLERDVFRRLVVFQGACVQLFEAMDPMLLQPLARPGDNAIQLLEGRGGTLDNQYIFPSPKPSGLLVALVPEESRLKALGSLKGFGNRMVLLGGEADAPAGRGFPVGGGLASVRVPRLAAEDLWRLNEARLEKLTRKGVRSAIALRLHAQATADRQRLAEAAAARAHAAERSLARGIWGRELNAYPEILKLSHEAVVAVILLLAFLAPWAVFMERVFVQSGGILGRIAGAAGFFAAAFGLIYWLHPAFQISQTPIMILVAYTLAALALLALTVLSARYSALMKAWRERVGGIHQSDISRAGAFMVAFNLGLSNMAKRRFRTILTMVMIALLSFSVMTFTSVRPYLAIRKIPLPAAQRLGYDGLLFRLYYWGGIDSATAETFVADLGAGVETVFRYWHGQPSPSGIPGPGGEGMESRFTRDETAAKPRVAALNALLGFEPGESRFSGLRECVRGAWFSGGKDELILPEDAAAALGIGPEDVEGRTPAEQVLVRFGTERLRVIGILDAARADAVLGPGGTPLAQIDRFLTGALDVRPSPAADARGLTLPVGDEVDTHWIPFARSALLPASLLKELGGGISSVAVRFPEGTDAERRIEELMSRFAMNLYASIGGRQYLIKTTQSQSISGAWKTVLPLGLVVLIMVNLMLGTVEERREEIKMLGAVGLAPRHVTILYLAESCCLGVLGLVLGVLLGLGVSQATRGMNVGVNVNYASVSTMLMGMLVLGVTIVSTLLPAARAARLATPSGAEQWALPESRDGHVTLALPFTLTRENGVGVFAFLHEYLSGHGDSTSDDFRCVELAAAIEAAPPDSSALAVAAKTWLAPYDMRVAQQIALRLEPTEARLFRVSYRARQISGELGAWNRANFEFVDLLRQQFLIYRTLPEERKREYVRKAGEVFI
jgi:hypothetical protein